MESLDTTQVVKKPTWWETATPEQRAERVAKMKAGREAAKAKREEKPKNTTNTMYIVLEGGSTKDWNIDTHVYKVCKTLEEAVEAMNARVDAYVTDYCLLEENPDRVIPRVTVAKMQERIAKAHRTLIFGVNVIDTPEDDEEDGDEENWDRGMWGNLLLTLQIKKE